MWTERRLKPKQPSAEIAEKRSGGYISTLDGWRAFAILLVLLGHSQPWQFDHFSTDYLRGFGDRGVDLFFALSGFLICSRLLREEAAFGRISLRFFYLRRLFRIQPAALTYLAVVALLGLSGLVALDIRGIVGAVLMVRNLWPPPPGKGYWYTAHFWSLAVEEHFYLLLPAFLVFCRRHRLKILLGLVIALQAWQFWVFQHPALQKFGILIYLRTDIRLDRILLGTLLALALTRIEVREAAQHRLVPAVAVGYTILTLIYQAFHHSRFDNLPLICVYPLLICATVLHPRSWLGRILELPPVRFVGRISYSLYLWQELFLDPFSTPALRSFRSHNSLCWASASLCAIASYYLVEKPLIRIGHRFSNRLERRRGRSEFQVATAGAGHE